MKPLFKLFVIIAVITSCKKSKNYPPPSTNNPTSGSILERSYDPITGSTSNFGVYGPPCWSTQLSWCCASSNNAQIFCQNGTCWIDSMNYVIREKVPITITNSSFTFNDYTTNNGHYHITGGTGYLYNDTLTFTANAKIGPQHPTSGSCGPGVNFTFKGKYKAL